MHIEHRIRFIFFFPNFPIETLDKRPESIIQHRSKSPGCALEIVLDDIGSANWAPRSALEFVGCALLLLVVVSHVSVTSVRRIRPVSLTTRDFPSFATVMVPSSPPCGFVPSCYWCGHHGYSQRVSMMGCL